MIRRTMCRACMGTLQLVETPRDAMQGLRDFIPTESKVRYLNALLRVGFHTLDCGSFVSAPAVPQMRDTAAVLKGLDMERGSGTKLLVIVANEKGVHRAAAEPRVTYIGYPLSLSETFQQNNTQRSVEAALGDVRRLLAVCEEKKKIPVVFISMAFGNPYGEEYVPERAVDFAEKVANMGAPIVSLSDTVGVADEALISTVVGETVRRVGNKTTVGAHLHSGTTSSVSKVVAALRAGCRRIDSTIGGMGGCPFAKSTLVGNVPTDAVVKALEQCGIPSPLNAAALAEAEAIKHELFGVGVKELLLASALRDERHFTALCTKHFERNDFEGHGFLAPAEFARCMRQVFAELGSQPPTEEKIASSFKKMDLNGCGLITLDEYMIGARRLLAKRLRALEEASA